ncbi:MAG: tRNA (cytidine(34)-2'-O)-methyltransferase [Candidatus Aminicenantaceae bacterium]
MNDLCLNVVLVEPEIPQNTGSIARTCAAIDAPLHLVKPLGFSLEDRYLKRAGLDYWHLVEVIHHESLEEFLKSVEGADLRFITKKAAQTYDRIDFSGEVYLVFGKETTGLPEDLLKSHEDRCYRIPMKSEARSLNLASAVTAVAYEACRQNGFDRLKLDGSEEFS